MKSWNRYIKDFVSFLKIERGLAENSIFAYQNDVLKLHDFAVVEEKKEIKIEKNKKRLQIDKSFEWQR